MWLCPALRADNTGTDFLLFTSGGLLNRMSMETYSYTVIPIPNAQPNPNLQPNPIALVFNPDTHRVYFTEVMSSPGSQVYSADLDGQHPVLLKQLPHSQYPITPWSSRRLFAPSSYQTHARTHARTHTHTHTHNMYVYIPAVG